MGANVKLAYLTAGKLAGYLAPLKQRRQEVLYHD